MFCSHLPCAEGHHQNEMYWILMYDEWAGFCLADTGANTLTNARISQYIDTQQVLKALLLNCF